MGSVICIPPFPVYEKLLELVKDQDSFVLTTNVDHCFQKAVFDKTGLFYKQGDYGLWQCVGPCHSKTYDNETVVRQMVAEQRDMRIPADLIPRCPKCGGPLTMNLRCDDTFVEDKGWQMAAERYEDFIRRHKGFGVVYLELGGGANTPGIVKCPFWQMAAGNKNATYAWGNLGEAYCPAEISERSICIDGDIKDFLDEMLKVGD